MSEFEHLIEHEKKLEKITVQYWMHDTVFSWKWWILLCMLVVPWIFYFVWVRRRKVANDNAYIIFLSMLLITFMDSIGMGMNTYSFVTKILPLKYPMISIDVSLFPVLMVALFSYCRTWKNYIAGAAFIAFLITLTVRYILIPFKMMIMYEDKFFLLFVIFFSVILILRIVTERVTAVQKSH